MHLVDLPLLDVLGMGIGGVEQALGEMAHNGMGVQEFLIVEALGEQLFLCRGVDQSGLVGKEEFLAAKLLTRLVEELVLAAFRHIEEDHARVDIVGI